jgi:ketosteroid isomerase-like protein
MSQENVEVVLRAFEAWQRDDFEGWICLVDADIEWHPAIERGLSHVVYRGHEGASELWNRWRSEVDDFWVETHEIHDLGDERVLHLAHLGFRGSASGAEASRNWHC